MAKRRVPRIQVAVRLPAPLVAMLDQAAAADAAAGWAPSRSRTLTKILPPALQPLVEKAERDREEARQ